MFIVVLITTKDSAEANKISVKLLENKLIACANIMSGVKSIFQWQGKITNAEEALMIVKTKQDYFPEIVKLVKSLHSYDTPEIIALPVILGDKDYLDWVNESC